MNKQYPIQSVFGDLVLLNMYNQIFSWFINYFRIIYKSIDIYQSNVFEYDQTNLISKVDRTMRGLSVFFEQTIYQPEKDNRDLKLGL